MNKRVLLFTGLILLIFTGIAYGAEPDKRQAKPVVSILGDSYSTFENYIPSANETWYSTRSTKRTDVTDVKQTWWWQLISEGGYILGVNNSYSGSTISYTGYDNEDYVSRSFISRLNNLGSPDILLIFGATNDSWAGVKMGEDCFDNKITGAQLYYFRPAMSRLLNEAINRYPGTDIYFILNTELKPEINDAVKSICAHYNVKCIELQNIDKQSGHPSIEGMKNICRQVLDQLN